MVTGEAQRDPKEECELGSPSNEGTPDHGTSVPDGV